MIDPSLKVKPGAETPCAGLGFHLLPIGTISQHDIPESRFSPEGEFCRVNEVHRSLDGFQVRDVDDPYISLAPGKPAGDVLSANLARELRQVNGIWDHLDIREAQPAQTPSHVLCG